MPRITHVKKAQQRYATKPVLDADGKPIQIPLTKNGQPKLTKHGRPVTITKTVRDLERPLPPLKCDYAGCEFPDKEIKPGMAYKHMSPRSGPFGGRQINRHEECPTWNHWDYSDSIDARVAQIQSEGGYAIDNATLDEEGDAEALREEIADMARELHSEKEDNLNSLPDALQETGEFYERVQALESWVDAIDGADLPDFPEVEDTVERWHVTGPDSQDLDEEGFETEDEAKDELETWLRNHPDEDEDEWGIEVVDHDVEDPEVDEETLEAWRDEVRESIRSALDEFSG